MNRRLLGGMALLSLLLLTTTVYADHHRKMRHRGRGQDLESKFFHKVRLALIYQEKLGISDEQYSKIKTLKINTRKDIIKRQAEIDIIGIEIKAKMWEGKIDIKGVNKLIDQKYELKKVKAKTLVESYARFKSILTKEQMKKLRTISHKSYKK